MSTEIKGIGWQRPSARQTPDDILASDVPSVRPNRLEDWLSVDGGAVGPLAKLYSRATGLPPVALPVFLGVGFLLYRRFRK